MKKLQFCFSIEGQDQKRKINMNIQTCQYVGPIFDLPNDAAFEKAAASSSPISDKLMARYIRNTIYMMDGVTQKSDNRYPTAKELEIMAQSIVARFPSLADKDSENKNVNT